MNRRQRVKAAKAALVQELTLAGVKVLARAGRRAVVGDPEVMDALKSGYLRVLAGPERPRIKPWRRHSFARLKRSALAPCEYVDKSVDNS
jgi:hypothetical protein